MVNRNENLRVTYWSMGINLALGLLKCLFGLFGNSRALVVDGLHSLLDLSTDLAVVFGLKMAAKPEDANHPYGHHKFANLANLLIAIALLVFCLGILHDAVMTFYRGDALAPSAWALGAACLSLAVKEGLFWWTRFIARKNQSRLLLANAWHHRTDSFSSLAVALAILGALVMGEGWAFIDSLAGVVLGLYLMFEAVKLLRASCMDLLDTAPEVAIINDLREHVLPTPGARAYHNFRARRVGDMIEVDLHLQVDPELSVERGHRIAREVRENILRRHPEVVDVLIHVEPATPEHLKRQGVFAFARPVPEPGDAEE